MSIGTAASSRPGSTARASATRAQRRNVTASPRSTIPATGARRLMESSHGRSSPVLTGAQGIGGIGLSGRGGLASQREALRVLVARLNRATLRREDSQSGTREFREAESARKRYRRILLDDRLFEEFIEGHGAVAADGNEASLGNGQLGSGQGSLGNGERWPGRT